ncbi:MAG TPA: hypothetical protein VFL42_11815 [Terriglobales bacterium]|jgi:hypothetical protein|nr:hypothetical protein [Terriglobales bacterium]
MRSDYVFAAIKKIDNRFMLCRVTSVSARRLQVNSKQSSETINRSLRLIAGMASGQNGAGEELGGDSGHFFSLAAPELPNKKEITAGPLEAVPSAS